MNTKTVHAACMKHGAKAVYAAAFARMKGLYEPLTMLGLAAATLAEADFIATEAFKLLDPNAKAEDLNKRLGLNLTWRDILQWPLPEGVKIAIGPGGQESVGTKPVGRPAAEPSPSSPNDSGDD